MDFPAENRLPRPLYELLQSAYPAMLGERDRIIAEFVRAAYHPGIHDPEQLRNTVRLGLRNSIRLAASPIEQGRQREALIRFCQFPKSGKTYARRVLEVVAYARTGGVA